MRQIRQALRLLLLTACRPGELRFALWDEFDLERALWSIPAEVSRCLSKTVTGESRCLT